jgi:predicted patatin/cPLA2 family phospholipase
MNRPTYVNATKKMGITWEGGGARGIGHGGVYAALHSTGILQQLHCAGGASIGALFALFSAMRTPTEKVIDYILNVNLGDFTAKSVPNRYVACLELVRHWGIFSPAPLFDYVRRIVRDEFIRQRGESPTNGRETLADVYALHKCHVLATVTDIGSRETLIFSSADRHYADMPAFFAIGVSMTMPLIFRPVFWRGRYLVDGGLSNGLPYKAVCDVLGCDERDHRQKSVILAAFDEDDHNDAALAENRRIKPKLSSLVDFIGNVIQTLNNSRGTTTFVKEFQCQLNNMLLIRTPGVTSLTLYVKVDIKQDIINTVYGQSVSFFRKNFGHACYVDKNKN